jgi:hypothetical protein
MPEKYFPGILSTNFIHLVQQDLKSVGKTTIRQPISNSIKAKANNVPSI